MTDLDTVFKFCSYDDIPKPMLRGKILDIGAGVGHTQLLSKHAGLFRRKSATGEYKGVDIDLIADPLLDIEQADFLTWEPDATYDTILALNLIEHIPLYSWSAFFNKTKQLLNKGGWLIVSAPYREPRHLIHSHLVDEIDEEMMKYFLPGCKLYLSSVRTKPVYPKAKKVLSHLRGYLQKFPRERVIPFKMNRRFFITFWRKNK